MSETTAETLAEIEGQVEHMLPNGWRVVPLHEPLRGGDDYHGGLNRYIRRIEPEHQPEPQPQPEPDYTPPKGWRVLVDGEVIQAGDMWVRPKKSQECERRIGTIVRDETFIRRIEQPEPEPQPQSEAQADYTPPEGWRVLQEGETITLGDRWVRLEDGQLFDARRIGDIVRDGTFLRRIPQPEPQTAEYTAPKGWRLLQPGEALHPGDAWAHPQADLFEESLNLTGVAGKHGYYLRRIEPEPEPEPEPQPEASPVLQQVTIEAQAETIERLNSENVELQIQVESFKGRLQEQTAKSAKRLEHVRELRSEVSYVQGLLGESRRRVEELETLASDLRAVNAATEKAVNSAYRDKADLESRLRAVSAEFGVQLETNQGLQTQLEAVKAELVQVSKDRHALQVELDAAQQVPADSPELRQLRADLAEVTQDRDTYRHAHELLLNDVNATHQRTKAMTVEAIAEWLEPFRTCGSHGLSYHVMQNLPHIMRTLTGLADTED